MADNRKRFNLEIHPTVFWVSAGLMVFFVLATLTNLERASETFNAVQSAISTSAGWFYVLSVNIYLGIVVYLLLSRYGHIRLGGTEAQPDFSYWGWFSMLFSAGMGIGLAGDALGAWALALGAAGFASAILSLFLNLDLDKAKGLAEGDAVGYPGMAGFKLEDGIYLIAPITWLGWLEPFFVLCGIGATVYCLWTAWSLAKLGLAKPN